jgi:hypothetical protein
MNPIFARNGSSDLHRPEPKAIGVDPDRLLRLIDVRELSENKFKAVSYNPQVIFTSLGVWERRLLVTYIEATWALRNR